MLWVDKQTHNENGEQGKGEGVWGFLQNTVKHASGKLLRLGLWTEPRGLNI